MDPLNDPEYDPENDPENESQEENAPALTQSPELHSEEFEATYETLKTSYHTVGRLTKYERTKVISERSTQISNGSPILVEKPPNVTNAYEIAILELQARKIPFLIKRPYGNTFEYWKLKDLL